MILEIITIYFLAGFPVSMACAVALTLADHKKLKNAFTIQTILFYLITFVFWPYFAWAVFRNNMLHATKCAHCGELAYGEDQIRNHMYICPKNPVATELNAARKVCQWADESLSGPLQEASWFEAVPLVREWKETVLEPRHD